MSSIVPRAAENRWEEGILYQTLSSLPALLRGLVHSCPVRTPLGPNQSSEWYRRWQTGLAWRDRACFVVVAVLPATPAPCAAAGGYVGTRALDPSVAVHSFYTLCGPRHLLSNSALVCLPAKCTVWRHVIPLVLEYFIGNVSRFKRSCFQRSLSCTCPGRPCELCTYW